MDAFSHSEMMKEIRKTRTKTNYGKASKSLGNLLTPSQSYRVIAIPFFFLLPFGCCCCFINFSAWQIKIPFRGQNPEASHMGFRARNYFFFHAKWKSKLITSSTWAFAPLLCFWYDALNETKSSCTIVHMMKEEKRKFRCSRLSTHLFLSCSTHFELVK